MNPFTIDPEQYEDQLNVKTTKFQHALVDLMPAPKLEIFTSEKSHYRLRAEFKIWHEGDSSCYAMHDPKSKKPIFLKEFPTACKQINSLMPPIMEAINQTPVLRHKLFQIEFLSTLNKDTLVTFIYHKPLDNTWQDAVIPLKNKLNIHIIGRSRKQKIILDRDYVTETLQVYDHKYHYQQNEGSFTQPNGQVCEKMLEWAVEHTRNSTGDLLELYCGNGNFSLPLAQNFNHVVATEISKSSVQSAQNNIRKNNIQNVSIVRMSSEDFTDAMDKVRPFRRLANIDLENYQFSTVLVDPPRAGLDIQTTSMIQRFEKIIYISCNPETLIENLKQLLKSHQIVHLAAFDQFPYTPHLEAGVILEKRQ